MQCRLICIVVVVLSLSSTSSGQGVASSTKDPGAVMRAVYKRAARGARIGRLKLVIDDGSGSPRERTLTLRTEGTEGTRKTLIMVEQPADVRGTGFVTIEASGNSDDAERWLYMPRLKRVTRVADGQLSSAFLGSDFAFGDLGQASPERFSFSMVRPSESVDGETCWVIDASPKTADMRQSIGYRKARLWISKDKLTYVRMRLETTQSGKTKYFQASGFRKLDSVWTPQKVVARTVVNGKRQSESTLTTLELRSVADVPDSDFSKRRLERGP